MTRRANTSERASSHTISRHFLAGLWSNDTNEGVGRAKYRVASRRCWMLSSRARTLANMSIGELMRPCPGWSPPHPLGIIVDICAERAKAIGKISPGNTSCRGPDAPVGYSVGKLFKLSAGT